MNIEVDRDELEYLIEGLKDQLEYYCDKEDQEERDAINRLLGRLRDAELASRADLSHQSGSRDAAHHRAIR
jgi:hypothetical protein